MAVWSMTRREGAPKAATCATPRACSSYERTECVDEFRLRFFRCQKLVVTSEGKSHDTDHEAHNLSHNYAHTTHTPPPTTLDTLNDVQEGEWRGA